MVSVVHHFSLRALFQLHAMRLLVTALALSILVRAMEDELEPEFPYPAQITKPAELHDVLERLLVDDRAGIASVVNWAPPWNLVEEPHMKQKREQYEGSDDQKLTTKDTDGTRTKEDTLSTKTKDEEGAKKTSSSDNPKHERPTKTHTGSPDGPSTLTVSLRPSSTTTIEPLPSPFDAAVTTDFKSYDGDDSCPNFMNDLLSSPTFKKCYPISMLIQTSTGFFQARKHLTSTVRVLDAACAADVSTCTDFMKTAAKNLTAQENCKVEYDDGLAVVMQAYRGLRAYSVLYSATCMLDHATENYCYANAVTNITIPSDAYLYFLPYDLGLPGSSTPSCNACNQDTMSIFHAASADRSQFIADTYEDAARLVNTICGADFVNSTLPDPVRALSPSLSIPTLPALTGAFGLALVLSYMM